MLKRLKEHKSKIITHATALVIGLVLVAISGSIMEQDVNGTAIFAFLYGAFGQSYVAGLLGKKLK